MRILVVGGLSPDFQEGSAEEACARSLGQAIAAGGHVLLSGCYNRFDSIVAEGAHEIARQTPIFANAADAIHTYVSQAQSRPTGWAAFRNSTSAAGTRVNRTGAFRNLSSSAMHSS